VNGPSPRLVVALRKRPSIAETLESMLPGVAWRYLEDGLSDGSAVEALLVGSISRELGDFDPASTPKLALVQGIYTGLDGFPFGRFPEPIQIAGNVGGIAPFVAEHAIALALGSARALRAGDRMVAEGKLRPPPSASTLLGGTALILGYGAIGREVARRLEGFGVRRVGLNRTGRMAPNLEAAYPADRLNDALAEADLVIDVRPLTRSTAGSIGAAQFACMRPEAIYVNVGRAGTVDEGALYEHLATHPTFRAGLDVWWAEDYGAGTVGQRFPWTELPNFLGTPHSAAAVPAAERYGLRLAVENLRLFFSGKPARNIADRRDYVDPAPVVVASGGPPGTADPLPARFR
jgi:phosphoglycerate dehydrogenase-like enzyme